MLQYALVWSGLVCPFYPPPHAEGHNLGWHAIICDYTWPRPFILGLVVINVQLRAFVNFRSALIAIYAHFIVRRWFSTSGQKIQADPPNNTKIPDCWESLYWTIQCMVYIQQQASATLPIVHVRESLTGYFYPMSATLVIVLLVSLVYAVAGDARRDNFSLMLITIALNMFGLVVVTGLAISQGVIQERLFI